MTQSPYRLEALQALRAIAAAFVVLIHAFYTYADKIGPLPEGGPKYDLATFGVKLFFCISGFIISTSAARLDRGWASLSVFARRRLIRVVPLYWAATLIYAVKLSLQGDAPSIENLVRSLMFVPYADDHRSMRPVLGVGWTLNFEMLFYAVLGISLLGRRAWRVPAVTGLLGALVAARLLGWTTSTYGPDETAWGLMADPVLLFFVVGMLVGTEPAHRLAAKMAPQNSATRLRRTFLVLGAVTLPATVLGLDALGTPGSPPVLALELLVCSVLVFLCIEPRGHFLSELTPRWRRWVECAGDASYSTYLVHGFVMGPAGRALAALDLHPPVWIFAAAMVPISTAAGIAVYAFFERPLLARLNARWGRIRPR